MTAYVASVDPDLHGMVQEFGTAKDANALLKLEIEASKLLLENDVKLKAQKPKSTTVKFNDFSNYESDDSYYDSEPEPQAVTKPVAKLVKQWGMSTRNKKSVKNVTQPIKEKEKAVESNYQEPVYF